MTGVRVTRTPAQRAAIREALDVSVSANTRPSLADYAASSGRQRGVPCSTCSLPDDLRSEVDQALAAGTGPTTVADWLVEVHGIDTNAQRLYKHRSANHKARYANG